MDRRLELQHMLEDMLGSRNVYYQPSASVTMNYPAIKYSKENIQSTYANDSSYLKRNRYQIIVIDRKPDNEVISQLLDWQFSQYSNHYVSENLHHDVITLYF